MTLESVAAEVDALRDRVHKLAGRAGEPPDPFGAAGKMFAEELRALLGDAPPDPGAVRRAARFAAADQAWTARLGNLLETRDIVQLLKVSKQRVSTLAREHRIICLPQGARQRFPAWQFAVPAPEDRECLAAAHEQLVRVGALSPWAAASWFQKGHQELGGRDPVAFLRRGGDRDRVLRAAARDAERLAH